MISELNFFKKIEHVLFNTNAFVITGNPLDNFIISSQNCSLYYKSSMIKNLNNTCCSLFIFFLEFVGYIIPIILAVKILYGI